MSDKRPMTWPCYILEDRYGGTYSGGKWVAVSPAVGSRLEAVDDVVNGGGFIAADFPSCVLGWAADGTFVGLGDTPDQALGALEKALIEAGRRNQ